MPGDKTEELILEIEKNPILYDKSRSDYKDADKKKDVWKEIADRVGLTREYTIFLITRNKREPSIDTVDHNILIISVSRTSDHLISVSKTHIVLPLNCSPW